MQPKFCQSLFQYHRNKTIPVKVGTLLMGGEAPIRIQSMTTTNTLDTDATVDQTLRIAKAGGELVRITTQGRREAENLQAIKEALKAKGSLVPLAADVHFNPNAAEIAATRVEKVRINPGNFMGEAKKFRHVEASPAEEAEELQLIRARLKPFIQLCKDHHTAIRIGTNHGSLSDRIMSRYGDTPEGMVQSCMEYLRICREEAFHNIVLSIKSSNTRIMVHTVRMLVARMAEEKMHYPLHLGVTEAGHGEDGRIKSAVGIGALLADGIGDTIRVSLTEPPEKEIPVAKILVDHLSQRSHHAAIAPVDDTHYHPFDYKRRVSHQVLNVGKSQPAVVLVDLRGKETPETTETIPDQVLCENPDQQLPTNWEKTIKVVPYPMLPANASPHLIPLFGEAYAQEWKSYQGPCLLEINYPQLTAERCAALREKPQTILLLNTQNKNGTAEQRAFFLKMEDEGLTHPVIVHRSYDEADDETLQIKAAADTGLLFLDGYGDGLCLSAPRQAVSKCLSIQFGILQASRVRFTKTEYISCPGCGRTLYDLQTAASRVKAKTSHLKGLKIAIMGCVVNGLGEMADADYGYVGAGPGRISLYRNRELVKRNVPEKEAVSELIQLIKEYGDWSDPS